MKQIIPFILVVLLVIALLFTMADNRDLRKERDLYRKSIERDIATERARLKGEIEKNIKLRDWLNKNMDSLKNENKRLREQDSLYHREIVRIRGRYDNKTSQELRQKMIDAYEAAKI